MKIFCSYAHTGEDLDVTVQRMRAVVEALDGQGHESYCNLFDPHIDELQKGDDIPGIFRDAFERVMVCDALLMIVSSPRRSMGQMMEMGVAMSHDKPVYIAAHESAVLSYLPRLADRVWHWQTKDELLEVMRKV